MPIPIAPPRLITSVLSRILAAVVLNAVLFGAAWATTVSWDGGGDGISWNNGLNWSSNAVPNGADSVAIGSGYTVRITTSSAALNLDCDGTLQVQNSFTVGSPSSANHLQVTSGTFTVSGDLTVTGSLTWSSATLTGAGTTILAPGATGTFNTTSRTLLNRTFRNEGFITWTVGSLTLSTGGIWDNLAGSTLDVQGNLNLAQSGSGNGFRNYGTVLRSAGTGQFDVNVNFTNFPTGLVRGEIGTVRFSTGLTNSGRFEFLPGTVLGTFGGGGRTFDPTSSLIADTFNAGMGSSHHTVTISGNYDVATTIVSFTSAAPLGASAGLFFNHPDTLVNLVMGPAHSRLSVVGDLLVTGSLDWQGSTATMQGAGTTTLDPGATATLSANSMFVTGRTLRNETNAVWTNGTVTLSTGGIFDNIAGATLDIRDDVTLTQSGTGNGFRNYGTVLRTAGAGIANMNANFSNFVDGLVRGETGTVRFSAGLTNSGRFEFLPGSVVQTYGNGGRTFDATSSLVASTFNVGGDDGFHTVTISGNYDVTNTIVDYCGSCGALAPGSGLFITHPDTMTNVTLNAESRLSVDGDLLITGSLAWNDGYHQGPGTTTLAPGSFATLATSGSKILEGRTMNNEGTVVWQDTGELSLRNGGVFNNQAGRLFEARGVTTLSQSGSGNGFVNNGTVLRTTSTGRVTINAPFVNTVGGLVRGEMGIARFSGSTSSSGRFEFLPGTTLETFGNPGKVFDATSSLVASTLNVGGDDGFHTVTVMGNYDVTNTIVDFCGSCGSLAASTGLFITHPDTMTNLTLESLSRLSVVGDLLITGNLIWNQGFHQGSGTTTLAPTATANLATSGSKVLDGRTLQNQTTVNWNGGECQLNNGSQVVNTGSFLARFDGLMRRGTGTATSYFYNNGLFRKEASAGTTNVDGGICFVNTGVVDVDTGILRFSGCYPSLTGTYNVASTLQIDSVPVPDCTEAAITLETAGAQVLNGSGQSLVGDLDCITTTGSITVQGGKNYLTDGPMENSGALTIEASSAVTVNGNYTQLAGTTLVEDGTLTAPLIDIAGGLVRAQGLFDGNTRNAGRLEIGVPIGKLDIAGWYEQASAGTLVFDIGGRVPVIEYDQLDISGQATLNGTLEVQLVNGFMPAPGDSFQIILYDSHTGVFANLVLPSLQPGLQWEIDYGSTGVTLYIEAADFILTAAAGLGGMIAPSGADTVSYGEDVTYTITPDACYQVADVLVDNLSVGAVTNYAFTDVAANHTIAATFALIPYTVTATAGTGGGISPSGGVAVTCGADQSFTITPDACYQVADVLVDNLSVGAVTNYAFTDVAANHTIAATFALIPYTVTATAGTGGGISPSGGVAVTCGADQSFTITPDPGYVVLDVLVNGSSVGTTTSYEFMDVTAPHTISVSFVQDHPTEVTVSGTVTSDCNGPLLGVTVDLIDAQGEFHTTTTDESGAYAFPDTPYSEEEGAAEVSIAIPLGHEAVNPGVAGQALTLDQDQVVDFTLACLDPTGPPRSMGYWKHNANVYLTGKGNAQESQADMTTNFPQLIFNHFYENGLNDIPVEGVTYTGAPAGPLTLSAISATLTVNNGGTMLARAKQQYLAFLLNLASGKLGTSSVVTADGGTASQVLQYVADLINDGISSNDEKAKDLCDTINNAQIIAAGQVPLGAYTTIAYAPDRLANLPLMVSPNPGSVGVQVFSFGVSSPGEAVLEVYDVNGRRVAAPFSGHLDTGEHRFTWSGLSDDGRRIAGGIYFGRLISAEGVRTVRFVRLGR